MKARFKTRLILDNGPYPGWFNMGADQYLSDTLANSPYDFAIRFYTWKPPALSLGKHQSLDGVNLDYCRRSGWDVVQRPTGGRALLHLNDLSYSIVTSIGEDSYQKLHRIYSCAAKAISQSLTLLGINSTYQEAVKGSKGKMSFRNRACLSSRTRGEVTARGRKVACAAQRVYRDVILQHGSIMLKGDAAAIAPALVMGNHEQDQLIQRLRAQSQSLEGLSGTGLDDKRLTDQLIEQFALQLNLDLTAVSWTNDDMMFIRQYRDSFDLFTVSTGTEMIADG